MIRVLAALVMAVVVGAPGVRPLRLSTTTSTENSGLLSVLLPPFEKRFGLKVDVVAVGSGAALRLAENGDADVVLTHAPGLEKSFLSAGHGVNPRAVMFNDFVIVGPRKDPAGVAGLHDAVAALKRIAEHQAPFISRGDDSGTYHKEKNLWKRAGIQPAGDWYREAGQGMGQVLVIASEMNAYTLSDRGTYLAMRKQLRIRVLVEGDPRLRNPYAIMAVNPARHPQADYLRAMMLIAWVTSPEGQTLIRDYRVGDKPLFIPLAVP